MEQTMKHPTGNTDITFIPFVKEGTPTMPNSNAKKQGIIQQASDWTLQADLDKKLQWGTTDIQSCPIKLPPLFRAPAVWVVPV